MTDQRRKREKRDNSPNATRPEPDAVARPLLPSPAPCGHEPNGDRLLTVNEAAALLGLAPGTLRNWAYQRRIPRVKLFGGPRGALRFRQSDVQKLIRASLQPALRNPGTPRDGL